MRFFPPSSTPTALRLLLTGALPLCVFAVLSSWLAPARAASVTYEITGTLTGGTVFATPGMNIDNLIAAIGLDGGRFRATVTLDTSVADADSSATRGLYLGAVTASTLQVGSTVFTHSNGCNLALNVLDCSVEALNDHPERAGSLFKKDRWSLNSHDFSSATVPGLPSSLAMSATFSLNVIEMLRQADTVPLLDDTALDFGLERLGAEVPGLFALDFGGVFSGPLAGQFLTRWRESDLQVTRVLDEPDPAQVPEPGSACLALMALAACRLRTGPARQRLRSGAV